MEKAWIIPALIKKLFKGRITSDELKDLNGWYDSFEKSDADEEVTVFSNRSEDNETVKKRMLSRILNEIRPDKSTGTNIYYIAGTYWKAAASIAFLMIVSAGILYFAGAFDKKGIESGWNEKKTAMGEKSVISLADGSKITLNADSRIRYQRRTVGNGIREVFLEGEAYFEINHNNSKTFVVHTGEITTTDLGTKFNVSAFPADNKISVALVEGKVKVSVNTPVPGSTGLDLTPSYELIYDRGEKRSSVEKFDQQEATGWLNNILVFRKLPLDEVMVRLERAYGIKFVLPDNTAGRTMITANFMNESYQTVSEALKKTTGLGYRTIKEGSRIDSIVFFRKR